MEPDFLTRLLILICVALGITTLVLTYLVFRFRRLYKNYKRGFRAQQDRANEYSRNYDDMYEERQFFKRRCEALAEELENDQEIDGAIESIQKSIRGEA